VLNYILSLRVSWHGRERIFFQYWKRGRPNRTSKTISAADTDSRDNSTGLSQSLTLEAHTSFTTAFLEVPDKDSKIFFFHGLALEACTRDDPKTPWLVIPDWWSVKHSSFWTNMQQATYHTRSVCTQELLYEIEAFPHRSFCTKKLINTQNVFTGRRAQRQFYTQKLSHRHYYTKTEMTLSISFRQCFARQGKSKDSETL
jgi:hypothetical protein